MTRTARSIGAALGGPALISASILIALRQFVFSGMVSTQHPDLLSQWLPVHCFLGRSLAAGNIPEWNPFVMGGAPFAADPQSGWMNLPAMALYSNLPCGSALVWYIAVLPIIGGLGLYAWLRTEGLSRVAATTGGLALGLGVATSRLVLTLPFSGVLAWTAVTLAFCAGYVRARTTAGRVLFGVFTALAWGQAAAAHLSHGLVVTTAVLVIYLLVKAISRERGEGPRAHPIMFVALPLLALPLVNLAYLMPRLAYLPRTTMSIGYNGLDLAASRLSNLPLQHLADQWAMGASWVGGLATTPGTYLGACTFVLALSAFRSRHRSAVIALAVLGGLCWVASLEVVATALAPIFERVPFGDFYLHAPGRFGIGTLFALAALSGFGIDAFAQESDGRRRAVQVGSGVALACGLVALNSPAWASLALPAAGLALGVALLVAAHRRPLVLVGLPILLALELSLGGLAGASTSRAAPTSKAVMFDRLRTPDMSVGDYLNVGPIAHALREHPGARYLSFDPQSLGWRGYLTEHGRSSWGLMSDQSSMLFGIEDVQGYNPAQLRRYWRLFRAANTKSIKYNSAVLTDPTPLLLDLLGVEFVISRQPNAVEGELEPVASEPPWTLYRRQEGGTLASFFTEWTLQPDRKQLMRSLAMGETDSTDTLLLDVDPGVPQHADAGAAEVTYKRLGDEAVRVEIDAPTGGIVVVRNSFDPNWHASIDGRDTTAFPAQYLWTGVRVPGGRHSLLLVYEDPFVEYGLVGTGLSLLAAVLLVAALSLRGLTWRLPQPKNTSAVS